MLLSKLQYCVSILSVHRGKLTTPSLARMSVKDFMAGFGDSDDEGSEVMHTHEPKKRKLKLVVY